MVFRPMPIYNDRDLYHKGDSSMMKTIRAGHIVCDLRPTEQWL